MVLGVVLSAAVQEAMATAPATGDGGDGGGGGARAALVGLSLSYATQVKTVLAIQ